MLGVFYVEFEGCVRGVRQHVLEQLCQSIICLLHHVNNKILKLNTSFLPLILHIINSRCHVSDFQL